MLRFAFLWMVPLTLVWPTGCSDLTDASGAAGTGGGLVDPLPKIRPIKLGCTNNETAFVSDLTWDLTVDPGPIIGGEPFAARLSGVVATDAFVLGQSQTLVTGGYKRSILLDLQATVHVRGGVISDAVGDNDVLLTNQPIPRTCTYDGSGRTGLDAGPDFPPCSQDNDNPDGSNEDCTALGGGPDPMNGCHQFVTIPTSDECSPGGECESIGQTGTGSQCAARGFCVTGPLEVALTEVLTSYEAAPSGTVVFGWDDESTGAVEDSSGGPNQGTLILPLAVFGEPGPNSISLLLGADTEVALECTMGTSAGGLRVRRTPDDELIRFTIHAP